MKKRNHYTPPLMEGIEFSADVVTASLQGTDYNANDGDLVSPEDSFWA